MTPVTIAQLRATSIVDLMTAARALGLGRTKAYELARWQQFPLLFPLPMERSVRTKNVRSFICV